MAKMTKIDPAPVKYPNGGALKVVSDKKQASLEEKLQAHDMASAIKRKQIIEAHGRKR